MYTRRESSQCDPDESCQIGGCASDKYEGDITHIRLGGGQADDAGNTVFTVPVPDGAQSFAITVDGVGSELVLRAELSRHRARLLDLMQMWLSIERTQPMFTIPY